MWFLYFLECIERCFWAIACCDISKPMRTTVVGTTWKDALIGLLGILIIVLIIIGIMYLIKYFIKKNNKGNKKGKK